MSIFTAYKWLNISTPLIETIQYFLDKGEKVCLYALIAEGIDKNGHGLPTINHPNFSVVTVRPFRGSRFPILKVLLGIYIYIHNITNFRFTKLCLAFDPGGLYLSIASVALGRKKLIYHSLEISSYQSVEFLFEKIAVKFADIVLTQDLSRARILSVLYSRTLSTIDFVPNSTSGKIIKKRADVFRELFSIPKRKKIALMTGSIIPQAGAYEIVGSVGQWPKDWVLVINGWIPYTDLEAWVSTIKKKFPDKVFLNTNLFDQTRKFEVFSSVDACFVWFEPLDLNLKYALCSAGKMYDSTRVGTPLIFNKIPGATRTFSHFNIGVMSENGTRIPHALKEIGKKNSKYQENSFNFFKSQEFTKSYDSLLKKYSIAI
ncbi:hypothetical protein [Leptospira perolatii]|uniref:hypothetical protein n=1 Tax=Leptospira perolatii TaxID=2023191 RepID=UPI000F62F265|nr:hypothetical protein [Leptospira perolatii]